MFIKQPYVEKTLRKSDEYVGISDYGNGTDIIL